MSIVKSLYNGNFSYLKRKKIHQTNVVFLILFMSFFFYIQSQFSLADLFNLTSRKMKFIILNYTFVGTKIKRKKNGI